MHESSASVKNGGHGHRFSSGHTDTPDRPSLKQVHGGNFVDKVGVLILQRLKNTIVLSPVENAREHAPLFRKTRIERSRNSLGEQDKDKGKAPCSKLPSKSSGFPEDHAILDLTEQKTHNHVNEMESLQSGSENFLAEGRKNGKTIACISSINCLTKNCWEKKIGPKWLPMSNNGEADGIGDANRDACFEEKGGWRSTRNRSKNVDHAAEHHEGKIRILCDSPETHATETAPVIAKINQPSEPSNANMLPKRQIKHVLSSRNNGESSRATPNDPDIVFLCSSLESSTSRSSRIHIAEHPDVMDLDNSSRMRGIHANHMDSMNDEDTEANARQIEADEMLARELQEQLYHEVDENIAWALQQEDAFLPTPFRALHEPDHQGSTRQSRIQPPSRNFQNSSNRRGVQTHFPTSARVSRDSTFWKPWRLHWDADDMGKCSLDMAPALKRLRMLLTLDDNNHQHGGASVNQINCLPLSKYRLIITNLALYVLKPLPLEKLFAIFLVCINFIRTYAFLYLHNATLLSVFSDCFQVAYRCLFNRCAVYRSMADEENVMPGLQVIYRLNGNVPAQYGSKRSLKSTCFGGSSQRGERFGIFDERINSELHRSKDGMHANGGSGWQYFILS
ncbi:RING/U-box superfamily protein, putative isoform 2 [Hibiscus syriacus]|uniref:RING/U-box superfamily protein, putative isoform 2 n=1 Tax=Hibiscus syriacus TaxID=106335 RepID=A0A6A2Y2F5_HIBSY|nr:RING/U-box superfamily protein, putative isoform 2 [Hibiscus syriacus]